MDAGVLCYMTQAYAPYLSGGNSRVAAKPSTRLGDIYAWQRLDSKICARKTLLDWHLRRNGGVCESARRLVLHSKRYTLA
jgi:hypothetical protein